MRIHFISDAGNRHFRTLWIGWLLITTGELCLSPIGLSKVELSPKKSIAFLWDLVFIINRCTLYRSTCKVNCRAGKQQNCDYCYLKQLHTQANLSAAIESPEAMIYNDLFGKIGFVTLGIAILTLIFSPLIKKLMNDVH